MKWENSIVKIKVKSIEVDFSHPLNEYGTENSSGTGFFIKDNLILTCYHVVKYSVDIEVIYNYKNNSRAKIKYIFPDDDLAIIEIEKKFTDIKILKFKEIDGNENYDVFTIGFPLNSKTIKISKGIISGYQDSLIQTDATLNSGNSGGPLILYDGKEPKIIGINVSKMVGNAEKTGFVVPYYRYKILAKYLEHDNIIINKPLIYFDYQRIIQDELIDKVYEKHPDNKNKQNGVLITLINKKFYIYPHLQENDIILKVNDNDVDYNGYAKFDFFPEKINISELGLWFVEGDTLKFTILRNDIIINPVITLKIKETNILDYHIIPTSKRYFVKNNGLVLSIVTKSHLENFSKLELSLSKIVKILTRYSYQQDLFTVYLADLDFESKNTFHKYPIGDIIIEINDKRFNNYEEFNNLVAKNINKIKTIDNEIYYINKSKKE
jgi:S1-C subfamily serine protease